MSPLPMRPLFLLLAAALLAGCGPTPVEPPVVEIGGREPQDLAAQLCAGKSCTAGYCTNEGEDKAVCRCSPIEAALGLSCELDEVDDFDHDPARIPVVAVPTGPTPGRLHRGDVDTFAFEAVAGRAYRFTCTPEGFPACGVQFESRSGTVDGTLETHEGASSVHTFLAEESGWHSVRLSAWPWGATEERGTYRYALAEVADVEGAPAAGALVALTDGTPFGGHLDFPGDVDAFTFAAQAGHVYRVRCDGELLEPSLVGPGVPQSLSFTHGEWSREMVVELSITSEVLLHLRSYAQRLGTPYTCTLEALGPDDHGDTAALATALPALPAQLTGVLETKSDQDYFSFQAKAGHTYDLLCDAATQWVCDFTFIDHERRTLPPTPITVAEDRVLVVRVDGGNLHATGPGQVGPYALSVVEVARVGEPSVEDAVPLSPGIPASGRIELDWAAQLFRVDAQPGRVYRASIELPVHKNLSVFRASTPDLNLLRENSERLGYFKTEQAEPLYVRVTGLEGAYTLWLEEQGQDDHADSVAAATPVSSLLLRAEGLQDTVQDVDWFALDLEARTYSLRTFQSAYTARFSLVEADGVTPVPPDFMSDRVTPRSAGRHYLRVSTNSSYFRVQNHYLYELSPR